MPGPVVYVPSRVGEGYFTDWQAPVAGDNGRVWAYNHGTGKFEPYTIPTVAPGGSSGYIQYNNAGAFGASGVYWDAANSRVGIGVAPSYLLHLENSMTGSASEQNILYINSQINSGANTYNSIGRGFQGIMVSPSVVNASSTNFSGIYVRPQLNGSGTITNIAGLQVYPGYDYASNTNTVTTARGVWIKNWGNFAPQTFTEQHGLFVDSISGAVNNYAIYTNAGDIRLMASSSDKIGFHGVTPVARQLLATGAGATVDNVITALQNLGLVKQS